MKPAAAAAVADSDTLQLKKLSLKV